MRANAQNESCENLILTKNTEIPIMMFVTSRCTNPGPLGKSIPTRSFASFLFARLHGRAIARLRW